MQIPEIQLKKIVDGILIQVKKDWEAYTDKTKTLLYNYFYGNVFGTYDYYIQAQKIFLRDSGDSDKIESRIFFDSDRASLPTIHIMLPMEVPGEHGIGVDEDVNENIYDDTLNTYTPVYSRRFDSNYHLVCTSKNSLEVLLIYHLMKGMLIGLFDSLDLAWGFSNPKIGGGEIQLDPSLVPPNIYARVIDFNASYEINVPKIGNINSLIKTITFTGKVIEEEIVGKPIVPPDIVVEETGD